MYITRFTELWSFRIRLIKYFPFLATFRTGYFVALTLFLIRKCFSLVKLSTVIDWHRYLEKWRVYKCSGFIVFVSGIIGIDEAGRGPVIGPLVLCGVLVELAKEEELRSLGVKDSKLLSTQRREELFEPIKTVVKNYKIVSVSAQEIDALMQHINLNMIEAQKSIEIINSLDCDKVILDCPSANLNAYASVIKAKLNNKKIEVIAQFKADEKYLSVGAASILAKVTRDRAIQALKEKYDVDFGSGYMSDVVTQKFLGENYDKYPELFRTCWISWQNAKAKKMQKMLGEF